MTLVRIGAVLLACVAACSKSSSQAAGASGSAPAATAAAPAHAGGNFASGGATACDKYLTDDVFNKIVGAAPTTRKSLSAQACKVESASGASLTITLKNITPQSYDAFQEYLSDPQPLPGVGDRAVMSVAPTITAIKGNMGCDFDARRGDAPGALEGLPRAKALGAICNQIFVNTK